MVSALGEHCLCSPAERHVPGWGCGSKGWPAHARRPRHQIWVCAQAGNQRRLSPEGYQKQPEFQRSAAAGPEAAAGPAEQAQPDKLFMAAAASAAAQQHAAAAELVEKHEMNVLSTYTRASHVALAAVSAREELSDLHDTTALENLKRFARSREAAFMDVEEGAVLRGSARSAQVAQETFHAASTSGQHGVVQQSACAGLESITSGLPMPTGANHVYLCAHSAMGAG